MIRMRHFLLWMTLFLSLSASAQSAAQLYEQGKALYDAKKYEAALPKLKSAAEKGHKKAQYRLGYCYDKGKGVKEDDEKAFYWYAKAAAQNHAKAQYQLGRCYKKGEGTKVDLAKAVAYFQKAAKQDNADAMYALGKCYLKGQGVAADEQKAKSWFQKAVRDKKDGKDILKKIRTDAAEGDEDAVKILSLLGMKK